MQRREFLQASALTLVASPLAARGEARKIKIGQIGVTHAHASKLDAYRKSPDYEVVGVVEPNEAARKRAEATAAFKGVNWLTREQLLNTPGLQAVLVETHVRELLDNAEACVAAGKHIHIDKPAGTSLP